MRECFRVGTHPTSEAGYELIAMRAIAAHLEILQAEGMLTDERSTEL